VTKRKVVDFLRMLIREAKLTYSVLCRSPLSTSNFRYCCLSSSWW